MTIVQPYDRNQRRDPYAVNLDSQEIMLQGVAMDGRLLRYCTLGKNKSIHGVDGQLTLMDLHHEMAENIVS